MSTKAFIFDLDGVIVDTAKYHYLAWKKLAESLGIPFTHDDNEKLKGVSRRRSLELILELGGKSATDAEMETWMQSKNDDYLQYIQKMDESEVLPGVLHVLNHIRQKGHKIVLGSASKNARLILERANVMPYFDAIVDGNDVSKAKPDPEVFLLGAQRVGIHPDLCVVFEDAQAGIEAARNAGMTSIGIGDAEVLAAADHVFADFTQMDLTFIDQLANS